MWFIWTQGWDISVFSLLYSLSATSTKSNLLSALLLMGRVLGDIGTSLLFSAPEAWLVGEAGRGLVWARHLVW